MAILRSFGSILFINSLSIYNSPEEISSKPAIILKVVDLPHPEGPTKTINSLSSISIEKSKTAWTLPGYILLMFFNDNDAIHFLLNKSFLL